MEMVLRLRMPGVSSVHCERVARASLLIVLSGILYCCIRMYGGDVRIISEDAAVYSKAMMEKEYICGNVTGVSMGVCGQEIKNTAGQRIEEYRQSVGIVGRVEYSGQMKAADTEEEGVALWSFGRMEKLWPSENSGDTGIAEPEDSLENDFQKPGGFSGILEDNDNVDLPPIQDDEEVTDKVDEIREIGGFFVDAQGYIVGITDSLVLVDGILAIASDAKCVGIKADAFCGVEEDVFEIYIPTNICEIELGAFDGFANLMYIEVADGNPYYESIDGILYSKSGEEIAYPAGR